MKKLFFCSIPICLVSFILFGISVAIFDTKWRPVTGTDNVTERYENSFIDRTVTGLEEWTIQDVVPHVKLHTSGVKAYVYQSEDEYIHLRVSAGNSSVSVKAENNGNTMDIKISPPNVIFNGVVDFGKIFWQDDIFNGSPSAEVFIAFPKLIYESLEVEHGSGTLMIDGFNAAYNEIDIGSGRFEFSKSDQYTAEHFVADINSGSAIFSNMQTNNYEINIGSGRLDMNGLSGSGEINMGSGKGSIAYSSTFDCACDLNIGSGALDLYFPDNGGTTLCSTIGSGSVKIDAYGVEKKLGNDETVTLGAVEENSWCYIYMGSGKVNIRNTSAYTAPTMFENRPDLNKIGEITGLIVQADVIEYDAQAVASSSSSVRFIPGDGYAVVGVTEAPEVTAGGYFSDAAPIPEAPQAPLAPEATSP